MTSAVVGGGKLAVIGFAKMAKQSLSIFLSISSLSSILPRAILDEDAYIRKYL